MNWTNTLRRAGLSSGAQYFLTATLLLMLHGTAFGQPYVYERSFGTTGSGPGQFEQVTAIDQDSHGNYVILDGNVGEFQICNNIGKCSEYDTAAKAAGEYGSQWGLAVDSMDNIFITNQSWGKVEKCTQNEGCTIFLTEHDGLPIYPGGIAIDAKDRIFISDANYGRIIVCPPAGNCWSFGTWGNELGQFSSPYGLAINSRGQVVIADAGNQRVQACDHMGNCEYAGYENSNYYYYGGYYGQGITLLPSDLMITTGYGYGHVNACTPGGACRLVAWYDYNNTNYLNSPATVMVDNNGQLVIGDYGAVHFLAPNITLNPGINDAWIEPGIAGQGLLVSVFENISVMFIAWFTYDATRPAGLPAPEIGEWGHRWITLQGSYKGNVADLIIYHSEGGEFESKTTQPANAVEIGMAKLTVHDCYSATLDYAITGTNYQGTKNLVRIVSDNIPTCQILSGEN